MTTLKELAEYVEYGKNDEARAVTHKLLAENVNTEAIISEGIMAGLTNLGKRYEKFEAFVPELITAGLAAKDALEILRPKMTLQAMESTAKTLVIGTVEGDVHDVGKNIVAMMLEGGGFKVIDLGVDVPTDKFIAEVKHSNASILALSALYSPTRMAMKDVIGHIIEQGMRNKIKIMIGGAPIDQAFCDLIGADGYAPDAPSALALARTLVKNS